MINRRDFVSGMATLLAAPLRAVAQTEAGRVGFLGLTAPATAAPSTVDILRMALRERGWVEGANLIMEHRWAEGRAERLPDLARDLVAKRVNVIVAGAVPTVRAAQAATSSIPIVFVALPGPAVSALVADIGRPTGNVTGVSFQATPQQAAKELEVLREIAPNVSRVAVLRDRDAVEYAGGYQPYVRDAAATLKVSFHIAEFVKGQELDAVLAVASDAKPDALWIMATPMTFTERRRIADFALKRRLPSLAAFRQYADAGGLVSYGASLTALWRRSAYYVDRLLTGAKPSDLPVEQPSEFEIVVNLKTAKAIGVTVPQSLLLRADHVIE